MAKGYVKRIIFYWISKCNINCYKDEVSLLGTIVSNTNVFKMYIIKPISNASYIQTDPEYTNTLYIHPVLLIYFLLNHYL